MKALTGLLLLLCFTAAAQTRVAPSRSRSAAPQVTFNNHIVRILQQNCQTCHRPGAIAPFPLIRYQDAREQARSIKTATQSRRMPPWKPVAGFGEFQDERRLSPRDIDLIARWVDSGAPEGDPADLPAPIQFSDDWALGTPDLVVEMPATFQIPAQGDDIYRCFSIPLGLLQERHITGIEVQPGNRSITHHLVAFGDPLALSARIPAAGDGQPGYNCFGGPGISASIVLAAWAPGNLPQRFPAGVGLRVTPGARAVVQLHYHPNGTPQTDRTRIGFHFNRQPIQKDVQLIVPINERFVIPAGAERHTVTATETLPVNSRLIAILPHMHLLGREIKVEAAQPDGARQPLLYINDWDFDWQSTYYFKEPVALPARTRLELTAVYDNSAGNPRNPSNPPREVRFGERTTDEMCLAAILYVAE
jgi:mono/diheme cytochrome c family protein